VFEIFQKYTVFMPFLKSTSLLALIICLLLLKLSFSKTFSAPIRFNFDNLAIRSRFHRKPDCPHFVSLTQIFISIFVVSHRPGACLQDSPNPLVPPERGPPVLRAAGPAAGSLRAHSLWGRNRHIFSFGIRAPPCPLVLPASLEAL